MKLVKDLSDENSRLLRDNKRANESLDGMLKDNADLNNRLVNIAFQSPEDGGDIFDDAFADPAELAERAEKRQKAALQRQASAGQSGKAAPGMDSAMQKRQEATAAEVSRAVGASSPFWLSPLMQLRKPFDRLYTMYELSTLVGAVTSQVETALHALAAQIMPWVASGHCKIMCNDAT